MAANLPPSSFASTFRAIVVPKLRPIVEARGLFVALGIEGFSEAFGGIMTAALKRGAAHLSVEHLHALEDWAASALLTAIDAKARPVSDKVWDDIVEWDRRVCERFAVAEVAEVADAS